MSDFDAATFLASDEIAALKAERDALLGDWNALIAAIGAPTNGGAVGHAAALKADRDRLAREHAFQKDALDAMTAARDRLARELAIARATSVGPIQAYIEGLKAELSAARADAERYRWLRSRMFSRAVPYAVGTALDHEIDAARATDSAGDGQ